jgi:hypothetical protein
MALFAPAACPALYLAGTSGSDIAYVAFVLSVNSGPAELTLAQALADASLQGTFVFSLAPMDFAGDATQQQQFVTAVLAFLNPLPSVRGILWIDDPALVMAGNLSAGSVPFLGLTSDGTAVASGLLAPLTSSLNLVVSNGTALNAAGDTLQFSGQGVIAFSGATAPNAFQVSAGTLPFSGAARGCVQFATSIQLQSLHDTWQWGFQFVFANAVSPAGLISEWLPLADASGPSSGDMIGFDVAVDPNDPFNDANPLRTVLAFTGITNNGTGAPTTLASFYRTSKGDPVTLIPVGTAAAGQQPAALVFAQAQAITDNQDMFYVCPHGDFLIDTVPGPDHVTADLLCGLQGTEFLVVTPGTSAATASTIRFQSRNAAYVAKFPPPKASPVDAPFDPTAPPLNTTYLTSWATVLPANSAKPIGYVAQPKGSSLFGHDPIVWPACQTLLGSVDPGVTLPPAAPPFFPMAGYSGFTAGDGTLAFSIDQSEQFERLIIGPTRRGAIAKGGTRQHLSARAAVRTQGRMQDAAITVTTPSGVIAALSSTSGDAQWDEILLGQTVTPAATKLAFEKPSADLQTAFQTSQLFLVVANADHLARAGGTFANTLNTGNWLIEADIGNSPGYADYANVMIVKGMKGPLFDPNGDPKNNLITNPDKWTQAAEFAAPTITPNTIPQTSQLVVLSQWLQSYFVDAAKQADTDYFQDFNDLAKDPNWTGILVLRARIAAPPTDIAGILAGIKDPSKFYAHHLAVAISQVKDTGGDTGVGISGQSSIYGLIYYIDPEYDPKQPGAPVPPDPGQTYDFRVLTLKVLFENTAVKRFSSYAQLTLNQLFGSTVTGMGAGGNPYNSIILTGTFQNNNGLPVYGLGAIGDSAFLFNSNVLNKIEIVSAQLVTKSATASSVASAFNMTGYIDFQMLSTGGDSPEDIDLFSFGSPKNQLVSRSGLSFSNSLLDMTFDPNKPSGRTLVPDAGKIAFNIQTSTTRTGCLFTALALELQGLVRAASDDDTPSTQGYLPVVTDVRLGGVGKGWNGLRFRLNLGTPGALAGAVGLNAYLLLAWSPDSAGAGYRVTAGVQMPGSSAGAKLISLQTVLSLSYGIIQLLYADKPKGGGKQFMLVLNEIAIKLLGVLKLPPSGNTSFYLFGDASGDGAQQSGLGWYAAYNDKPKDGGGGDGEPRKQPARIGRRS